MTERLQGQTVVLIGGTAGMGLAAAEAAARAGAQVIVVSRTKARIDAAVAQIGKRATGRTLDIGEESAVSDFFEAIDPVDHVVVSANAASTVLGIVKPLAEMAIATAHDFLTTKFWGPFHVGKYAPKTLKEGGSMVFFSGAAARRSLPGHTAIAATNGAVEAFAKQLAKEIAPIRVNVISPGLVDTPAYDAIPEVNRKSMYEAAAVALPVGRIGAPADVADAVVFALGNGYLTGAVIDVDGGRQIQ